MVEGLTSSATDQGSAPRRVRDTPGACAPEPRDIEDPGASRAHARGGAAADCTRSDARNPGDSSGEATPVPIPNTEVKLSSAEDTERAAFRENRSSPGFLRFRACPASAVAGPTAPRRRRASVRRLSCRHDRTPGHPAGDAGARGGRPRGVPAPGLGRRPVARRRALARPPLPAPRVGAPDARSPARALPDAAHVGVPDVARGPRRRGAAPTRPGPFVPMAPVVLEGAGLGLPSEAAARRLAAPGDGGRRRASPWARSSWRAGRWRPAHPGPATTGRRRRPPGTAAPATAAPTGAPTAAPTRGARRRARRRRRPAIGDPAAAHLQGPAGRHAHRDRGPVRDDGGGDRGPQQHHEPVADPRRAGAQASPDRDRRGGRPPISAGRSGSRTSPRGPPPG